MIVLEYPQLTMDLHPCDCHTRQLPAATATLIFCNPCLRGGVVARVLHFDGLSSQRCHTLCRASTDMVQQYQRHKQPDILSLVLELVLTVPNPWQAIASVRNHVTVSVEHHRAYTFWAGIGFEAVLGVFIQPRQRHVSYRYCDGFSVVPE